MNDYSGQDSRRRFLRLSLVAGASAFLPRIAIAQASRPANIDWERTPVRLLMVERRGCVYCEAWDNEIGGGYAASGQGRKAPLLRVDIDGPWPDGLVLGRAPYITPTFILLKRGVEQARLEGYPGGAYFYSALGELFSEAGI